MLDVTPVTRNLESSPLFLGLEMEDFMIVAMAAMGGFFLGQFAFSGTHIFGVPANFFFLFVIAGGGFIGLTTLKYGKPRGYVFDLVDWYTKPREYSAMERDTVFTEEYIEHEEGEDA